MRIVIGLAYGVLGLLKAALGVFFCHASFSIPFTAGAVGGWLLGCGAVAHGLPFWWLPLAWAVIGGAVAGSAGKEWFESVFGRKKDGRE